jgi:tripartite-type tricarboxylate transporter receptor subunit TctC
MTGINMQQVPYRSGGEMVTALLGGQVHAMFVSVSSSIESIRAGKLRALAVTTATRSEALPHIPTVTEFVPGYEVSNWYGIGAPKNTAAEIIEILNRETHAGLADPPIKTRLAGLGIMPMPMTPTEFGKLVSDETEKWGKVIRAANIKAIQNLPKDSRGDFGQAPWAQAHACRLIKGDGPAATTADAAGVACSGRPALGPLQAPYREEDWR